jgi:hypothetical protein
MHIDDLTPEQRISVKHYGGAGMARFENDVRSADVSVRFNIFSDLEFIVTFRIYDANTDAFWAQETRRFDDYMDALLDAAFYTYPEPALPGVLQEI